MVDQAIAQLQEALARDPRSDEAYSLLGVAYGQKGMVIESIQALSTAVGLNPNSAPTHMNLAAALQRDGRLHEAVSELHEALRINPNYQKAQESLSAIQAQLQQQATPPPSPTAPQPSVFGAWEQATGAGIPCLSCKAQNNPDAQFCWQCGQAMKGGAPAPSPYAPMKPIPATAGEVPFEARERYGGFLGALWETWREACFSPGTLFEKVGQSEETGSPIVFAIICGSLGTIIMLGLQMGWQGAMMGIPGGARQAMGGMALTTGSFIVMAVLMPLFILVGLFIGAGILHLCLMICGGARKGFNTTLRVLCYAQSAQVFGVIPCCGGIIAGIWALVLEIIGLAKAHETDTWRAVLAVFLPVIVCGGIGIAVYVLAAAAFVGTMGAGRGF
jgi:hypothetical protein